MFNWASKSDFLSSCAYGIGLFCPLTEFFVHILFEYQQMCEWWESFDLGVAVASLKCDRLGECG